MANVVELALRAKDEASASIKGVQGALTSLKRTLAGIGVGLTVKAFIANIIEAEQATVKLDSAFKNTGETLGITRKGLDDLASSLQNTTTFSDDLVKEAESVLLIFDKVRGEGFERTIKVAADLTARLGGDLTDRVKSLGLALQDPEDGFTRLTRSGIKLDDSQVGLIKNLQASGDLVGAQNVLLKELERSYGGAAVAARNTLGGALTGLKNAFGDLFEGTREGSQGAVEAINSLSATLSSPEFKASMDSFIGGLATVIRLAAETAVGLKILFTGKGGNAFLDAQTEVEGLQANLDRLQLNLSKEGNSQKYINETIAAIDKTSASLADANERLIALKNNFASKLTSKPEGSTGSSKIEGPTGKREFNPQTRQELESGFEWLEDRKKQNDKLREDTRTSNQEQVDDYKKSMSDIKIALDRGLINEQQAADKRNEILENTFKEFDTSKYKKVIIEANEELTAFVRGAWEQVGRSIQSTLSDAIYAGEFSMKSLVDIVRRALSDIAAAIITSGIQKALVSQFTGGSGNGLGSLLGSFFGGGGGNSIAGGASAATGHAAGGRASGWGWVGEEGRELVNFGGGSQVYNARQLAFAGGGGSSLAFSPTTVFNVQGGGSDAKELESRMVQFINYTNQRNQEEFERKLARNGYGVR